MRHALRASLLAAAASVTVAMLAGCGTGSPTQPTGDTAHPLVGTWAGTLTLTPRGSADMSGAISWTFTVDPAAPVNGYSAVIRSDNPALPFSMVASTVLDLPATPPSPIYTTGDYVAPGNCRVTFSSIGTYTERHIDATFSSSNCDHQSLDGRISLSR